MIKELMIKDAAQVEKINRLARSLLGLYALVGQRVHVVTEDDVNSRSLDRLVKKMSAE